MADKGYLHRRSEDFGKLPEPLMHDPTVTDGAKVMYAHMHWRYGTDCQNFESRKSMAEMLDISDTAVTDRITELVEHDWVIAVARTNKRGRTTNFYHVFEYQADCIAWRQKHPDLEKPSIKLNVDGSRKHGRKSRRGVGGQPSHKKDDTTPTQVEQPGKSTQVDKPPVNSGSQQYPDPGIYPEEIKDSQSLSLRSSDCTPAAPTAPPKAETPLSVQVFGSGSSKVLLAELPDTTAVKAVGSSIPPPVPPPPPTPRPKREQALDAIRGLDAPITVKTAAIDEFNLWLNTNDSDPAFCQNLITEVFTDPRSWCKQFDPPKLPPAPSADGSWNIINLDTGEILETTDNPIYAKRRAKELNAIGGAKYVTRTVKPDKPPRNVKPWSALTRAMHEAIPENIRPPTCHYGKADRFAKALHEIGVTVDEVTAFVTWSYKNDDWLRAGGTNGAAIPCTMSYVHNHIKPWRARFAPRGGNVYIQDEYFKRRAAREPGAER